MASKKKKEAPFGACPACWTYHDVGDRLAPIIPANSPNVIIVKDWPFRTGNQADRFLLSTCEKLGVTPIIISARQCLIRGILTLDEIKRNRELTLLPTLTGYANLPVVVMGGFAGSLVAGGKCTETSMVNKVLELYGHTTAFTYSMDYWLEHRDAHSLSHIETTFKACLRAPVRVEYATSFPDDVSQIVVDVEGNSIEYPFRNESVLSLVGIKPLGKPIFMARPGELETYKDKLANETKLIVGHGVTFDLVHLQFLGYTFPKARIWDTMIYHKNLNPNEQLGFCGLKHLAKKYAGFPHWDAWFDSAIKKDPKTKKQILDPNNPEHWEKLKLYNAHDLYATEALYNQQKKEYIPFLLEMDYLKYVIKMIMNGFHVDKQQLGWMIMEIGGNLAELEGRVRTEFGLGKDFNFASPPQVLSFLQREVSAKISSTGVEVIGEYQGKHPFINALLEIRDLAKLKGTGLEGLKEYLDSNSLVHSSISVHGAETGRSSSSSPNLQNTDPRVRPLFTSRFKDGRLLHTDLAGIEYRLIGHISEDRVLLDVFNSGKDIHDEMYFALFGEAPPNKEERKKAKTGNFCGVYGGGYQKFILSTGMPDCDDSRRIFKLVSNRYPGVQKWKDNVIANLWRSKSYTKYIWSYS